MTVLNNKSCKLVSSGRYVFLDSLTSDDIHIADISQSLNQLKRFTGHYKLRPPLTVAQHTYLCYSIAQRRFPDEPLVHLDCVLHDFGEAFYGDIASPVKSLIKEQYKQMSDPIDTLIYQKFFKGEYTSDIHKKRVECDLISLDIERRQMWDVTEGDERYWPTIPEHTFGVDLFDDAYFNSGIELEHVYKSVLKTL